jgi:hypothetical protein
MMIVPISTAFSRKQPDLLHSNIESNTSDNCVNTVMPFCLFAVNTSFWF